jgi:hypothetical protein
MKIRRYNVEIERADGSSAEHLFIKSARVRGLYECLRVGDDMVIHRVEDSDSDHIYPDASYAA